MFSRIISELTMIFLVLAALVWGFYQFFVSKAEATTQLPICGVETYEFSSDGNNTRVDVNYDSDFQIDVTGFNGWSVTQLWLDEDDSSPITYVAFGGGNRNNFNPSSFGEINKVKVEVTKACPTPTVTPTP